MNNNKKSFIKYLIILSVTLFICFFELPYYVEIPGGLDNLNNKVKVKDAYKAEGSINLTYVSELKGTTPILLIALVHPDWDIISKKEDNIGTLDYESMLIRQQILMKQSYTTAIKFAYEEAKKDVDIISEKCYVTYVFEEADTSLEVGDEILSIDDKDIKSCDDISKIVLEKKENEFSNIKVINNGEEKSRKVKYTKISDKIAIGIEIGIEYILKTNPSYEFKFSNNEYGPSGGLMISLAVYNSLVEEDITGGYVIAGTGTLEPDGTVGAIGGVEYKLKGAEKKGADIFFVPSGENYLEAKKIKEDNNYKIKVVEVKNFSEALKYLKKNIVKK